MATIEKVKELDLSSKAYRDYVERTRKRDYEGLPLMEQDGSTGAYKAYVGEVVCRLGNANRPSQLCFKAFTGPYSLIHQLQNAPEPTEDKKKHLRGHNVVLEVRGRGGVSNAKLSEVDAFYRRVMLGGTTMNTSPPASTANKPQTLSATSSNRKRSVVDPGNSCATAAFNTEDDCDKEEERTPKQETGNDNSITNLARSPVPSQAAERVDLPASMPASLTTPDGEEMDLEMELKEIQMQKALQKTELREVQLVRKLAAMKRQKMT